MCERYKWVYFKRDYRGNKAMLLLANHLPEILLVNVTGIKIIGTNYLEKSLQVFDKHYRGQELVSTFATFQVVFGVFV